MFYIPLIPLRSPNFQIFEIRAMGKGKGVGIQERNGKGLYGNLRAIQGYVRIYTIC